MRILLANRYALPSIGGLQLSIDQLASRLVERGHEVVLLTMVVDDRSPSALAARILRRVAGRPVLLRDRSRPYDVVRTVDSRQAVTALRRRFEPDVVVAVVGGRTTLRFASAVLDAAEGVPTVAYICDVEGIELLRGEWTRPARVVANADRLAALASELGADPGMVPCPVEPSGSLVESSRRAVLYVNPHPRKGIAIAWELAAARPDIPFAFQESWRLKAEERDTMEQRAAALGNVELRPPVADPARIYADARLLLAPYGEEWPRVVDEAQANGIPVLGTGNRALGQAIGPGGLQVPADAPMEEWVAALGRMWDDAALYDELCAAAREHSRRPEISAAHLAERFERELTVVIGAQRGKVT